MKYYILSIIVIVLGTWAFIRSVNTQAHKGAGDYAVSGTRDTRPHKGKDTINIYCNNCDTISISFTNPADTNLYFNIMEMHSQIVQP